MITSSHGQNYLPSCSGRLNDVVVGLGSLVQWVLGTHDWMEPTRFHPRIEQCCTLLLLLLREDSHRCTCVLNNWSTVSRFVKNALLIIIINYDVITVSIGGGFHQAIYGTTNKTLVLLSRTGLWCM